MKISVRALLAIVFFLLSVVAVVLIVVYKSVPVGALIAWEVGWIIGLIYVNFAHGLAKLRNELHSFFNRRDSYGDDEPSDFAVLCHKVAGYILLIGLAIVLLVVAVVI